MSQYMAIAFLVLWALSIVYVRNDNGDWTASIVIGCCMSMCIIALGLGFIIVCMMALGMNIQ
jgi:hypothetical protein